MVCIFFLDIQSISDSEKRHERIDDHPIYKALKDYPFDAQSQYPYPKCEYYDPIELYLFGEFWIGVFLFFIGFICDPVEISVEEYPSKKS